MSAPDDADPEPAGSLLYATAPALLSKQDLGWWQSRCENFALIPVREGRLFSLENPERTAGLILAALERAKVTSLGLSNTKFNDAGLKEVAKMQQLTSLYLDGTKITDAGLGDIAKLQKLTRLILYNTKITNEGAAELKLALPKCKILHSYKAD